MKVGIVTYHRTLNYGACLQAIATRHILSNLGYEAYYVDYWPDYHSDSYRVFSIRRFFDLGIRSRLLYLKNAILYWRFRKCRINHFESFFSKYITPFCKPIEDEFDAIVYGSDQIWRKQPRIGSYNPVYFGYNNFRTKKHISFSASMGILPDNEKDKQIISDYLKHLDNISVRENNLRCLLNDLGYTDVKVTLDPTLLLTSDQWDEIIPSSRLVSKNYVLVYGVSDVPLEMTEILKFANAKGLDVVVLSGEATGYDTTKHFSTQDPSSFISLIKNADFVITSSFHGLAFSIIYKKQFLASYYNNSNRAETILDALGIHNRIIKKYSIIPAENPIIDYTEVDFRLKELKKKSLDYLQCLNSNK